MGIYLPYIFQRRPGQCYQRMGNPELVFTYNNQPVVLQQPVILQKASGNGILNCHNSQYGRIINHMPCQLPEGITINSLKIVILKEEPGRYIVVTPTYSLYCNFPFHIVIKKTPATGAGVHKLYSIHYIQAPAFIFLHR